MQHSYSARYKNIYLRPLRKEDIEKLRIWRNDKSKTRYLRQIGEITPEMQEKWYEQYMEDPDEIIFAIVETEELKRLVGSVALYNFKQETAEVGKIQIGDSEASGKGIGRISMAMAIKIGFQKLNRKKMVASVHQENIAAHKSDMRIGFIIVGSHSASMGGTEDEIEIDERRFMEVNPYASEIMLSEIESSP